MTTTATFTVPALTATDKTTGATLAVPSFNITVSVPPAVAVPPPVVVAPPVAGITYMYLNGVKTLAGDFTANGETTDYNHATSAGYNGGTHDILVSSTVPWPYFLPYWAANYMLPNPGYTHLTLALKPSLAGDTFGIHAERVGDQALPAIELTKYGPVPVAGQWGVYKVPLADLGVLGDKTLYKVLIQSHLATVPNSYELDAIGFTMD